MKTFFNHFLARKELLMLHLFFILFRLLFRITQLNTRIEYTELFENLKVYWLSESHEKTMGLIIVCGNLFYKIYHHFSVVEVERNMTRMSYGNRRSPKGHSISLYWFPTLWRL